MFLFGVRNQPCPRRSLLHCWQFSNNGTLTINWCEIDILIWGCMKPPCSKHSCASRSAHVCLIVILTIAFPSSNSNISIAVGQTLRNIIDCECRCDESFYRIYFDAVLKMLKYSYYCIFAVHIIISSVYFIHFQGGGNATCTSGCHWKSGQWSCWYPLPPPLLLL